MTFCGRLKRLRIYYSQKLNRDFDSLNESKNLKALCIRSIDCSDQILFKTSLKFPNLHQLELQLHSLFRNESNNKYCCSCQENELITVDSMAFCLERMKFLKKLKIAHYQILCLYDSKNIFELLADAAVEIEWLSIFKD